MLSWLVRADKLKCKRQRTVGAVSTMDDSDRSYSFLLENEGWILTTIDRSLVVNLRRSCSQSAEGNYHRYKNATCDDTRTMSPLRHL